MSHDYSNSTATYYACIIYVRMECMARKLRIALLLLLLTHTRIDANVKMKERKKINK